MEIKAIIFDADGVVINSPGYFSLQYEKEFGVSNDILQPFFKNKFQECVVGKADLKEELKKNLDVWKWQGTVEELLEYWFKAEHYIDDRVVEEIRNLQKKSIRCCLGTKQEKYRMEYIKNEMGFGKIFDKIYCSSDIGYKKPDRRFFEFIYDDLNKSEKISPEEIMLWDDKEENVIAAKELGWRSFFYENFNDFHEIISML